SAGRGDAVSECLHDRLAVFGATDRHADESTAEGVDVELEVEGEGLLSDGHRDGLAVADPLRTGKEAREGASKRHLIGAATAASASASRTVAFENVRDDASPPGNAQLVADVGAEVHETALPALVGREHRFDLRAVGRGDARVAVRLCRRGLRKVAGG